MAVTVIIPTLNEEDWIASAVTSAFAAGGAEVIVADGGGIDRPAPAATSACARRLLFQPMPARAVKLSPRAPSHETFGVLLPDARLHPGGPLTPKGPSPPRPTQRADHHPLSLGSGCRLFGAELSKMNCTSTLPNLGGPPIESPSPPAFPSWGRRCRQADEGAFHE